MNFIDIVINGNFEEVKSIINPSNINQQDENNGFTALHYCAQNGYLQIAQLLIDNGADVNIKDKYGNTALFKAVFFSQGRPAAEACR